MKTKTTEFERWGMVVLYAVAMAWVEAAVVYCVGWLAGTGWRRRLGYSFLAFGVWDIFYYLFLRALTGWPRSLLDWDILFLVPLPWWGPVWAPTSIALLMILWGTLMTKVERSPVPF